MLLITKARQAGPTARVVSSLSQCPPEPRGLLYHTHRVKGRVSSLWNRRPRCKVEKHRRQHSSNSSSETALGREAQAARMAVVLMADPESKHITCMRTAILLE